MLKKYSIFIAKCKKDAPAKFICSECDDCEFKSIPKSPYTLKEGRKLVMCLTEILKKDAMSGNYCYYAISLYDNEIEHIREVTYLNDNVGGAYEEDDFILVAEGDDDDDHCYCSNGSLD